jgi:hypothetical protein
VTGLFDRTAKRLAGGPTLLFAADPAGRLTDALLRYDPAMRVRGDRFVLGNGVLLHGPVPVTADLAVKAGLPGGMTTAYYAGVAAAGKAERRPDGDSQADGERLVRGLAARLGGTVHDGRPPMNLELRVSVYSGQPLPADEVTGVLRPFLPGRTLVTREAKLHGSYAIVSREAAPFFTMYWPPWVSDMKLDPPPPAIGELRRQNPCRWELCTSLPVQSAGREVRQTVGGAALALARRVAGVAVDAYGFPVSRPDDLMASWCRGT